MSPRADADAAVLESTARELHVPYYQWATILYSAMRALLEGRFAEAEAFRTEGFELGQRADPSNAAGLAGAQLAVLCREQGRVDELQSIIAAAHRVVPTNLVWRAAQIMADPSREATSSKPASSSRRARLAISRMCPTTSSGRSPGPCLRTAARGLGDADHAEVLYALLLPHRDQLVLLTNAVVFLGSVSHYLGILALTRGSFEEAAHHLEEAMACHLRLGAAPFHARTRLAYVRLLLVARRARATRSKSARCSTRSSKLPGGSGCTRCSTMPPRCSDRHRTGVLVTTAKVSAEWR